MAEKQNEPLIFIQTANCINSRKGPKTKSENIATTLPAVDVETLPLNDQSIIEKINYIQSFVTHRIVCEIIADQHYYGTIRYVTGDQLYFLDEMDVESTINIKKIREINILRIELLPQL